MIKIMIISLIVSVLIVILYRMVKRNKGEIPSAKGTVVAFISGFLLIPLSIIIFGLFLSLFAPDGIRGSASKTVDNSQCSASDMKRLARERASLNGRVTQVGKIRMGNFNYSAQFYPKNRTGRYEIWLKIECINGEAKVTDAQSFKVD